MGPLQETNTRTLEVLIVDDEIDICYLLSNILRLKKYHVKFVNNLAEALNIIDNQLLDIVFLDNHLPDGLGLDFIAPIKDKLPEAKVIMITANDSAADRKKAETEGADDFIAKPFTSSIIHSAIDMVLH